jgi:hypothetical protein
MPEEGLKNIKLTLTSFSDLLTDKTLTYFNIATGWDVNDNLISIVEITERFSFFLMMSCSDCQQKLWAMGL